MKIKQRKVLLDNLMYGNSQSKKLQDLTESVLHFVNNKTQLKTRHLRANQALYLTKKFSKAVMTRSRLKNIFQKTKARKIKKS